MQFYGTFSVNSFPRQVWKKSQMTFISTADVPIRQGKGTTSMEAYDLARYFLPDTNDRVNC
jgi:hypothetical protein